MSETIHGDKIQVGDIDGSIVAIGQGAQVIIQQTQSSVEIARQQAQQDRLVLAQNVGRYATALVSKAKGVLEVQLPQQETRQPFKSLYAYTLADAGRFYGREEAIGELLRIVGRNTLTVLHGDSGVGKTSILRAGLSPHLLANSHLPVLVTIRRRTICEEVKRTLLPDIDLVPLVSAMSLRGFLREIQDTVGPNTMVVLILDQFETIFSSAFSEQTRQSDFEELQECIADPTLDIRVIISIRDDMFGKLTGFESDIAKPYENHYLLPPPTLEEAREIIVRSADQAGITYEPELVDTILADFATEDIAPSQLQIVFGTLVDQLPHDQNQITTRQYTDAGRVSGILTNYLMAIKGQLVSDDREIAQAILECLVGSDRRRDAKTLSELREEITPLGFDANRLDGVLDYLLRKRIISPVQIGELADVYAFEIVHDYIAEQVEVSPEAQAKKVAHDLLARRVIDYRRFGSLLIPDELQTVQRQLVYLKLDEEEQSLVNKSKSEISKNRIRRRVIIAILILLPVALLLSFLQAEVRVAQQRIDHANTAVAIQRTADSEVVAATQALGALALAQETQQAELTTVQARSVSAQATQVSAEKDALLSSIVATRLSRAQTFDIGTDPAAALVLGARLWIAHGSTNHISVFDILDGSLLVTIPMPDQPNAFLYANGYVWISANTRVVTVDPTTLSIVDSFVIAGRAGDLAYDGSYIWISNEDGVTQWDPQDNLPIHKVFLPDGANKLEFDGRHLWVSSYRGTSLFVLDPESDQVVGEVFITEPVFDILFDGGTVWVTTDRTGLLRGLSPDTLQLSREYMLGTRLAGLTSDGTTLWVADYSDNVVFNLDPSTGAVLGHYRVGRGPVVLVFDRQQIWSLNHVDGTATAIPLQIPVPISPAQIAYDNGTLWIVDQRSPRLVGVDETTGEVVGNYLLSDTPSDLAVHDHSIWLTLRRSQQIVVINPSNGETVSALSVDGDAEAFLLTDAMLWAALGEQKEIMGIDLQSGEVSALYSIPGEPALLIELGDLLWVATQNTNRLVSINPREGSISSYALPGLPISMVPDEERDLVWIGIAGTNLVQAIDPATGLAAISIEMSHEPRALLIGYGDIWVAGGDMLSQIDIDRQEYLLQYQVGRGVFGMTFGKERVWVSSFTDKTVESIALEH